MYFSIFFPIFTHLVRLFAARLFPSPSASKIDLPPAGRLMPLITIIVNQSIHAILYYLRFISVIRINILFIVNHIVYHKIPTTVKNQK